MTEFTHFDRKGNAIMVDVSDKVPTSREAIACGKIFVGEEIYRAVERGSVAKGDVLGVARIAAIMASKKTSEIIPLCHPLPLTSCSIEFSMDEDEYSIEARATLRVHGSTGVEMEALHAVTVALLTIYDMCKALDKGMRLGEIRLLHKSGGKSGAYSSE